MSFTGTHTDTNTRTSKSLSLQQTLKGATTSLDARRKLVEDFVAVWAESDIPFAKMKKIRH